MHHISLPIPMWPNIHCKKKLRYISSYLIIHQKHLKVPALERECVALVVVWHQYQALQGFLCSFVLVKME
jgi:hypothetical protein